MTTGSVRPLRAWAMGLAALAALAAGGPAAAAPNTGRLSLLLGNDFTTAYFFRGIVQERRGFITQPYAEVGLKLYEGKGRDRSAASRSSAARGTASTPSGRAP
jgi:hypothetical protein